MSFTLQADSIERFQKFLEKVAETKTVYAVTDGNEILSTVSHNFIRDGEETKSVEDPDISEDASDIPVYPFWSSEAYPAYWLKSFADANLFVQEVDWETFKNFLNQLNEVNIPVGVEWNQRGAGLEILPAEMLEAIANIK